MIIKICIGSSCHLKGSYNVITRFKEVLKKYDAEEAVELQAAFCLNHCAEGVSAKMEYSGDSENEIFLHHLSADNVEEVFVNKILPLIQK